MHCTNRIMIQHPRNLEENGTCFVINQTPVENTIRRSFTPGDTNITPYKKLTKRPSPELINGITLENDLLSEVISKSNDWIWLFARYQSVQLVSFEGEIRQNIFGPTIQFWQSFLDMSQVLLDYIKSFRIGDWQLHLCSMEKMLSWFHVDDQINYARHFTHCFASFQKLDETHPSILDQFQRGNFAIKRTNGSFNMLPPDQVIEQTINKEQKSPAGIIGIATIIACVQRWVLSSHVIAEWSHDFKRNIGID